MSHGQLTQMVQGDSPVGGGGGGGGWWGELLRLLACNSWGYMLLLSSMNSDLEAFSIIQQMVASHH